MKKHGHLVVVSVDTILVAKLERKQVCIKVKLIVDYSACVKKDVFK